MSDPFVPIFKTAAVTNAGALIDYSTEGYMGAAYVKNNGPDTVYLAWEAIPAAGSVNDGRLSLIADQSINLDAAKYNSIGFKTAPGDSAVVEMAGFPRQGSSGMGVG